MPNRFEISDAIAAAIAGRDVVVRQRRPESEALWQPSPREQAVTQSRGDSLVVINWHHGPRHVFRVLVSLLPAGGIRVLGWRGMNSVGYRYMRYGDSVRIGTNFIYDPELVSEFRNILIGDADGR